MKFNCINRFKKKMKIMSIHALLINLNPELDSFHDLQRNFFPAIRTVTVDNINTYWIRDVV